MLLVQYLKSDVEEVLQCGVLHSDNRNATLVSLHNSRKVLIANDYDEPLSVTDVVFVAADQAEKGRDSDAIGSGNCRYQRIHSTQVWKKNMGKLYTLPNTTSSILFGKF